MLSGSLILKRQSEPMNRNLKFFIKTDVLIQTEEDLVLRATVHMPIYVYNENILCQHKTLAVGILVWLILSLVCTNRRNFAFFQKDREG